MTINLIKLVLKLFKHFRGTYNFTFSVRTLEVSCAISQSNYCWTYPNTRLPSLSRRFRAEVAPDDASWIPSLSPSKGLALAPLKVDTHKDFLTAPDWGWSPPKGTRARPHPPGSSLLPSRETLPPLALNRISGAVLRWVDCLPWVPDEDVSSKAAFLNIVSLWRKFLKLEHLNYSFLRFHKLAGTRLLGAERSDVALNFIITWLLAAVLYFINSRQVLKQVTLFKYA